MNKTFNEKWKAYKKFARKIGSFQARVAFSILYFLIITPVGVFIKNKDYLRLNSSPFWEEYDDGFEDIESMKKQ